MEIKSGALVLADISGYTRFTRMHLTSLLHAEEIISELLEAVIQAAEFPLQVSQLEGDAVLLFAEVALGREAEAAQDVARQIKQLFIAFIARERALIACDAGCMCDACNNIGQLKLKAVLHFGEFSVTRIQGVEELAGADVRLMRTLIKAPIASSEYVLMTGRFYALSGGLENRAPDEELEIASAASARVVIYFPQLAGPNRATPPGAGPAFSARLNQHAFARMLGRKPRARFSYLAEEQMNLIGYLLEGILSGLNLLRRAIRRLFRGGKTGMGIKRVVLVLIEITGDSQTGPQVEQIKTELLKAVIEAAHPPLALNKLEGDAAFLYALANSDEAGVARTVARQVEELFKKFRAKAHALAEDSHYSAEVRQAVSNLRFKALLHCGEAAFKNIRQFEEIAGEEVILIHRLLKNSVPAQDYVLMTERFYQRSGGLENSEAETRQETAEGFGEVPVRMFTLGVVK
jgi:class 3 adenylate cyclase